MKFWDWLELVLGLGIVAVTLYDVFQAVVVPRWTSDRLRFSPYLVGGLWVPWRAIGCRFRSAARRENFLAAFAPLVLPVLLAVWASALILGFGFALHALRAGVKPTLADLGTSWYFAGVCLFTLGFGEMAPVSPLARIVSVAASASGMALVTLIVSLLFNIHGAFQRREVLVLILESRAGAPPSGVTLLESFGWLKMRDDLPALFTAWEKWTADVLESHRAFPILPYFRSSQGRESWMAALEAVLDAATLLQTTVEAGPQGAAHLMRQLGIRAVMDLTMRRGLEIPDDVELSREQFEVARRRLALAGYPLRETEVSWRDFAASRRQYAGSLTALARYFGAPPADWLAGSQPNEKQPTPSVEPDEDLEFP